MDNFTDADMYDDYTINDNIITITPLPFLITIYNNINPYHDIYTIINNLIYNNNEINNE
jgi:hypothetical protein